MKLWGEFAGATNHLAQLEPGKGRLLSVSAQHIWKTLSGNDASNAKPKDFFPVGSLNAREVISRSGHFPFTKEVARTARVAVTAAFLAAPDDKSPPPMPSAASAQQLVAWCQADLVIPQPSLSRRVRRFLQAIAAMSRRILFRTIKKMLLIHCGPVTMWP